MSENETYESGLLLDDEGSDQEVETRESPSTYQKSPDFDLDQESENESDKDNRRLNNRRANGNDHRAPQIDQEEDGVDEDNEAYGIEEDEEENQKRSRKRMRRLDHEKEEGQENEDLGDGKQLFEDIFGSASDEEEDIKRQIESAGTDELISIEQRGLQQRKYLLPDFPAPNVDEDLYHLKTPNTMHIIEKRYTENDYIEQGMSQAIRWRYKMDEYGEYLRDAFGRPQIESNAKIVKWSDDTYQLYIGGTKSDGSDAIIYEISASNLIGKAQNHHLFVTTKQSSCSFDLGKFSQSFNLQALTDIPLQPTQTAVDPMEKKRTIRIHGMAPRESELEKQVRDLKKKLKSKRQKREEDFGALNVDFLEEGLDEDFVSRKKGAGKKTTKSKSRTARRLEEIELDEDFEEEEDLDEYEEDEEYEIQEESDDEYEDTTYKPGSKRKRR